MSRRLVIGVSAGLLGLFAFGLWWERRQRLAAQNEWRRVLPLTPPLVAFSEPALDDFSEEPALDELELREPEPISAAAPSVSARPTAAAPRPFSIDDEEAGAPEDLGVSFLRGATETDAPEEPDLFGFHVQDSP